MGRSQAGRFDRVELSRDPLELALYSTPKTLLHPHRRRFLRRFKRSPDCLGPEHIREYQAELFKKR